MDAISRIEAAGLPPGFLSLDPAALRQAAAAGAQFIAVDVDAALLRRGALARLAEWQ